MSDDQNYQPVTINGVTYLPMDMCTNLDKAKAREIEARKFGCIPQRVKSISAGGFFSNDFAVCVYLVPVDKINQWLELE